MTDLWDATACETMEWRNPLGETIRFRVLKGTIGRFMPPVGNTTLPVPMGSGSRYLGSAHLERLVAVPVAMPGVFDGRDDLRYWGRALDPAKGEGTLTVVNGAWAGRQLRCVYEAGLDELEERSAQVNTGVLLYRCAWPYWTEGTEQGVEIGQGDTEQTWFPFLPLILGASDAFATVTINNTGDVDAWPHITVTGPGQEVEIRNDTTGRLLHITGTIATGSVLEVVTQPGQKSVRIDGANAFNRITHTSALWPLVPGPNRVTMSAAITSPDTTITFAYRRNWQGA